MSKQIETTIDVQLENRDRILVAFRLILVVPIALFLSAFTAWSDSSFLAAYAAGFAFLPALLAILFRGVYPSYVLAFNKALLGLSTRVTAYATVLTDRYPSIEDDESVNITYPEIDGGRALNRGLVLVKWLLAIPLYIVGIFYIIYAFVLVVFAWFTILATGSMPAAAADGIVRTIQYWNRVSGYAVLLVTDEYPSFSL